MNPAGIHHRETPDPWTEAFDDAAGGAARLLEPRTPGGNITGVLLEMGRPGGR